ncbi:MAG: hypothetical protein WCX28_00710 [Bacteriovoracaceae bacterium]|nr:hypothetical protein [Bacteroidota bacterium]
MDSWKIESNPRKQTVVTWGIIIAGIIFVYGFRNFDGSQLSNSLAGFLMGILLLIIGIPGAFFIGKQTITVDRASARIVIEDKSRIRKKKKIIPFNDIIKISVSQSGSQWNGSVSYFVLLKLISGNQYPLFYPSYYDGRWDKSIIEERCGKIREMVKV